MLKIGDRLESYTLSAGEPWIMSVQMRHMVGSAIADWSNRRLVLSFYDGSRAQVAQIEGVYTSDGSGAYFAFIRDGRFSESLYGRGLQVELAERLSEGRAIIATGGLSIAPSAGGVASFGAVIGRVEARFTLYYNVSGLIELIEQDLLPYAATPVTPAPSFSVSPSITSDGTPQVDEQLTGNDGTIANADSVTRRWLLGSTALATSATYTPTQTGSHTYEVTATGVGGTTVASASVLVAAADVTPTPTPPADPTPTNDMLPALTTSGASYHQVLSTSRLVPGYTGPLVRIGVGGSDLSGTDVASADLGGSPQSIGVCFDQSGRNAFVSQGNSAALQPRMRSELARSSRLPMGFFGIENNPIRSSMATDFGKIGLTGNDRTEFIVFQPSYSVQNAVWAAYAADGGVEARDLYTVQAGASNPAAAGQGNVRAAQADAPVIVPSRPVVMALVDAPNGANTKLYVDGVPYPVNRPGGTASSAEGLRQLLLGFSPGNGDIYNANMQVWAYGSVDKALNSTDIANLTAALTNRFGVRTAHDCNLVMIGDSIAEGVQATDTMGLWQYLRPALYKTTNYYNLGISGKSQGECYRDRAAYEGVLFKPGKINVAIIQAGINDIHSRGTLPADLYNNTTIPYVAYLKALGYKVAVATLLPQTASAGTVNNVDEVNNRRVAYNNLVKTNTAGADFLIDLAAESHMGIYPTAPNDLSLYPDKIHPSSLGYSYLAPVYASAINALTA